MDEDDWEDESQKKLKNGKQLSEDKADQPVVEPMFSLV